VRTVARRPIGPSHRDHPKLVHVQADLRSPAARDALAGVDVLFHLGFSLWRRDRDMAEVNLAGTQNVVAALTSTKGGAGATVVLASSASVYGAWPDNPLPLAEHHAPRPNDECAYALHKLEVERACSDHVRTIALRIGAVLGRHADATVKRSARGYRLGVPAIRGVQQAVQFVHEDDVVDALHAAAHHQTFEGPVNVATEDWLTASDIATLAGGRVIRLPRSVLVSASEVALRLRLAPFGADRAILLNGPLALDSTLARERLGWSPKKSSTQTLVEFLQLVAPQKHARS
jgi:nucleoside-diphosphate-sugar epimerase